MLEKLETQANVAYLAAVDACDKHGEYNSLHEGYAVLLEEVDELWDLVKLKQGARTAEDIRAEAIDVAVCALRIAAQATQEGWVGG